MSGTFCPMLPNRRLDVGPGVRLPIGAIERSADVHPQICDIRGIVVPILRDSTSVR
jgi:hypothetical protein